MDVWHISTPPLATHRPFSGTLPLGVGWCHAHTWAPTPNPHHTGLLARACDPADRCSLHSIPQLAECPPTVELRPFCHISVILTAKATKQSRNSTVNATKLCFDCVRGCFCLFGSLSGSWIVTAEGNFYLHRSGLLRVLIRPLYAVANVLF